MTDFADSARPPEAALLSGDDARALDALLESGLDAERASRGADPARVERVASLLHLLGAAPGSPDPLLVDVTMARVMQAARSKAEPAMNFHDGAALDAWVMCGFNAERVPASLRERARRHQRLAALVTAPDPDADGALVDRTLATVQAAIDTEEDRLRLQTERLRLGSGVRLADLVSVAAVLLIAAAVVWPVFGRLREEGQRLACFNNMHTTANAFGSYAMSNRDSLPMAASMGSGPWWNVGSQSGRSNSANLFQLTRQGYARLADLACPGNPAAPTEARPDARDWRTSDEVSYSYQIMFGRERPTWAARTPTVVMADRSPVVVKSMRGEAVSPLADSLNHKTRGQHVLFSDGHAVWMTTPELSNGDNIWLPRVVENRIRELTGKPVPPPLKGVETPDSASDAFVGP